MPKKVDFIQIVDCIFKNKDNYKKLEDQDKDDNFFIINRKFSLKFPLHANLFNKEGIDKSSALDVWFEFFRKNKGVPGWYWAKNPKEKEKRIIPNADRKLIIQYCEISEKDADFLINNYLDEVKDEIKTIKRFKKD